MTGEEISLAGGTPKAYFEREGIQDPVMLLARVMWGEAKSSLDGTKKGTDRTMANVGWIVKVRLLSNWLNLGPTYSAQLVSSQFHALRNPDLLNPLGLNQIESNMFYTAFARAEKIYLHNKIPREYKTLDSFSATWAENRIRLIDDDLHWFYNNSSTDDNMSIWDSSLKWDD